MLDLDRTPLCVLDQILSTAQNWFQFILFHDQFKNYFKKLHIIQKHLFTLCPCKVPLSPRWLATITGENFRGLILGDSQSLLQPSLLPDEYLSYRFIITFKLLNNDVSKQTSHRTTVCSIQMWHYVELPHRSTMSWNSVFKASPNIQGEHLKRDIASGWW